MGETDCKSIKRKFLLISLVSNLSLLFFFKYYNFFADSLNDIFIASGLNERVPALDILLPVGISFYTFQTLSYSFDVYKNQRVPEKHFGMFALYVTFFPQLVAGPIERSTTLLPQFKNRIELLPDNITQGTKKIIWGLFKKLVIADRLSIYVDSVYSNPASSSSATLVMATLFFAFQIYCDFSGYSDIAIGSAKMLGINLMENFRRPYFSKNISEFWSRWHISLSTWFKDYLYIPLGGNRASAFKSNLNLLIVFTVSGLWHGANWTFVAWGALHGISLIIIKQIQKIKLSIYLKSKFRRIYTLISIILTFIFVTVTWIFFRASTITEALNIFCRIIKFDNLIPKIEKHSIYGLIGLSVLLMIEFKQEILPNKFNFFSSDYFFVRYLAYSLLLILILMIGVFDGSQFIYFQF